MGNVMSCFDRWGKRSPDGPLLAAKPGQSQKGSLSARISDASTASGGSTPIKTPNAAAGVSSSPSGGAAGPGGTERSARRRPTYSSKTRKSDTEVSSFAETSEEETEEDEEVSAKDLRQQKIGQYRKDLTQVVRLKSSLLAETVKISCSKDGAEIQWFKGKSASKAEEKAKKGPAGSFSLDKISGVKAQADNPKALTVSVSNPATTNYSITFKTREAREKWQASLDSLRKFMTMK